MTLLPRKPILNRKKRAFKVHTAMKTVPTPDSRSGKQGALRNDNRPYLNSVEELAQELYSP